MRLAFRSLLIAMLLTLPLAFATDIYTGEDVLRAMHDRYPNWYTTLTFTQKSTTYNADGTNKAETWYEAAMLPGKLRIDVGPPSAGNGILLSDGNAAFFRDGKQAGERPLVNMLLVLGFDVYRQAPETSIKVVKGEGYDLAKLHDDTWDGKPVYVVGAEKGNLNARQFWVEKDTLLFVRELEPAREDPKKFEDIRFMDYRKVDGGWLAGRVEVHQDDRLTFSEEYSDIQINPKLDPAVFDAKQFTSVHWEKP
jgi:outer membrane lipoprotein-sorting protein